MYDDNLKIEGPIVVMGSDGDVLDISGPFRNFMVISPDVLSILLDKFGLKTEANDVALLVDKSSAGKLNDC